MEPISATMSIAEEPDSFGPGAAHDAFLAVAVGLMRGAAVLAAAPPSESAWAFALLSGQILECSLKAFLSKAGVTQEELNRIGHNLSELWLRAANRGLEPLTPGLGNYGAPRWARIPCWRTCAAERRGARRLLCGLVLSARIWRTPETSNSTD